MAYPQGFVQELKMRSPIHDVIGRYVELKRAGRNMVGQCPFHSEKTPSFTVFEDNFHCFGCGAGGDVITFTMRIENLDYRDAVNFLADRCGMTVPQDDRKFSNIEKPRLTRERAFSMNKAAARIFYENLASPDGEQARKYLADRQLTRATITRFGLGFAKNEFYDLYNKLCGISGKFKELWKKGNEESPSQPVQSPATGEQAAKFCGHCGAQNTQNATFCGGCGQNL